jgi:Anti-sigma-K factor rskA, C-terminal
MTIDTGYSNGCSEEFAELCALSTSGELSADELATLNEHVAGCAPCTALLSEYTGLAHVGMAKLAADHHLNRAIETPLGYDEAKGEERFVAFRAHQPTWQSRFQPGVHQVTAIDRWRSIKRPAILIGTAAALLVCAGGAFELGRRMAAVPSPPTFTTVVRSPAAPDEEKAQLKTELATAQASLKTATDKSVDIERQLAALSDATTLLLAQIEALTRKDNADSGSLAALTQQRDALQQQLDEASGALVRAREDLNHAQRDRQGALFRVASLESEIKDLHSELAATSNAAGNDEKFLSADRDIRELMGARDLYIADVFDVKNNGERSRPFGRVFYTKGRRLIFYAFDLQAQSGYREAKAFQAWGKPDRSSGKPISLGIFYEDSEKNQRWVLKADNPEVLARINAVFVTVEPRGGSEKPTGKPFLEAYLHSLPPNHP